MNRLPCDLIQDLLPLYHDGVTSETTARAVETHLETCPACRAEYETLAASLPTAFSRDEEDPKSLFRKTIKAWRRRHDGYSLVVFLLIACLLLVGGNYLLHGDFVPVSKAQVKEVRVYPYEDADGNQNIFVLYVLPSYSSLSLNSQLSKLGSERIMEYRPAHAPLAKDATDLHGWDVYCEIITEPNIDKIKVCGKTVWTAEDPVPADIPPYVYACDAHLDRSEEIPVWPSTLLLDPLTYYAWNFNYLGFQAPDGRVTLWSLDGDLLYDSIPTPRELFLHHVGWLPYSDP